MIQPKQNRRVDFLLMIAVIIGAAFAVWILIKPELP